MKPSTESSRSIPLGYNVRLPVKDLPVVTGLSRAHGFRRTNRLIARADVEMIGLCESTEFHLFKGTIFRELDPAKRKSWKKLADRDIRRSVSNSESAPVKITFPLNSRNALRRISRYLRWAEGQLVLEAFKAACQLAAATEPLESMPDFLGLYRGRLAQDGVVPAQSWNILLGRLNVQLGLVPKFDLETSGKDSNRGAFPLESLALLETELDLI